MKILLLSLYAIHPLLNCLNVTPLIFTEVLSLRLYCKAIPNTLKAKIPKINIASQIISNVDPFNETEYRKSLEKGIAHAKNTSLPGEKSTTFLFAHSSDLPWRITRYNIAFFRLPELKRGDSINIFRNGKTYKYKVSDKKTVWPNEVNYLLDTKKNQLILQTCVPIGTSFQRLLVFADPI